jgi:Pyruvate/2-oxoacid:ferredoxin oxidoreductase delta subunit
MGARYSRRAFLLAHRASATGGAQEGALGAERAIAVISAQCLARRSIACMSCRDNCPEDAIRFRPRAGGPFLPEIDTEACSGCGECVGACPADAITLTVLPREVARG